MPISLPVSPEGPLRKETPLEQALKSLDTLQKRYEESSGAMVDPDKMREIQDKVRRLIEVNRKAKRLDMDYDPALDDIDSQAA